MRYAVRVDDGWRRLITRAGAALDGAALRIMGAAMERSGPRRPPAHAAELLRELADFYGRDEHIHDPDRFFVRPEPARVAVTRRGDLSDGGAILDLDFPSTYEPRHPAYRREHERYVENLTAHARWFRAGGPMRMAMICLHGWGGGGYWLEERAFVARYWLRAGLDVVLFQLPFHGHRAPRQAPRSGALFPSPHVVRTNEGFAQAVSDLRALIAWLRSRDVPAAGLIGMSLGGYTTALMASLERDLAFAVPMIPAVSMSELMWRHGAGSPARRRAEAVGVTQHLLDAAFRVHAPLARPPLVAAERRFLIAGRGDRITPPDQALRLWEHWGRPTLHWFPGGHLAQVGRGDAYRALRRWLDGRAR